MHRSRRSLWSVLHPPPPPRSSFSDLRQCRPNTTGMNYEGIYRKSGGNGQTKLITLHFEKGVEFDLLDIDKFNDLAAVTSCMKNFFRSLPDPLFTMDLHERFVECTGSS